MLANIVDDLYLYVQWNNVAVAYFFCRHDIPQSLNARMILGSLARQLLHLIPDTSPAKDFLDATGLALDIEKLFALL
jgi:hypothetical protein